MASGKTKSLARAAEILDCFRSDAPELGVSEIARKLHMSRSTVGRLLATMRSLRILSQNGETRRYMLGPKVLAWSAVHGGLLDIREKSRAALEELHRLTRETASLYLLDGNERVCIDRIESRNPERVLSSPGERMPLHAGAGGKVLLAFMTPERRAQILDSIPLKKMTSKTITNRATLRKEIESIRARGYAISRGECTENTLGISTPVFDANGGVIAALTVTGPSNRFTGDEIAGLSSKMAHASSRISRALGHKSLSRKPGDE